MRHPMFHHFPSNNFDSIIKLSDTSHLQRSKLFIKKTTKQIIIFFIDMGTLEFLKWPKDVNDLNPKSYK